MLTTVRQKPWQKTQLWGLYKTQDGSLCRLSPTPFGTTPVTKGPRLLCPGSNLNRFREFPVAIYNSSFADRAVESVFLPEYARVQVAWRFNRSAFRRATNSQYVAFAPFRIRYSNRLHTVLTRAKKWNFFAILINSPIEMGWERFLGLKSIGFVALNANGHLARKMALPASTSSTRFPRNWEAEGSWVGKKVGCS